MPDDAVVTSEATTATLEQPADAGASDTPPEEAKVKLVQQVVIADAGPCRKHIKVTIDRAEIESRMKDKVKEMMPTANVPGYRPGKAPRKLIEKLFLKDFQEQIKGELLLQSLEQVAEDHKLNPITQPDIDPYKIEMPEDGPLSYEFNIEVAPEFDLPAYKGLRIKRPVKDFSEQDVNDALKRLLRSYGTMEDKDGAAQLDDYIVADVVISLGGNEISRFNDLDIRLDPQLAFKDGVANDFGKVMAGIKVGEARECDILLSQNLANADLRGQTARGKFTAKKVRRLVLPEMTPEFLAVLGVENEDQLREQIRAILRRKLELEQRKAAREQVLNYISASASWDLPQEMLMRQARRTFSRRILELQQAGYADEEIRTHARLLEQNALQMTAKSLKEQFVLQKIAEIENIEVSEEDVDFEVENLAEQSNESPRKVRARLEREDLMESLMTQIIERKALDLVLSTAEYEDVPLEPEQAVGAVEASASGAEPNVAAPMGSLAE